LSEGRLRFGAGLGSLREAEYAAFGEDASDAARAERLDEGLEIIRGLWSGRPFAYRGRHYTVAETVFVPTPVQQPLPIWVGGRWPNRAPFRRAARWDGVFPTHRDVGHAETMSPQQLQEIVDYTLSRRERSGPFDVVIEGQSPADPDEAGAVVRRFSDAGLTWWIEKLGWFRGPVDEMRRRIEAGPSS
jgi:alkanesulfonate monooxygenase SsuD/methylene tetrahydromethanopterin reductase-like flavin-dependent oxidoreductase (luciferase family)